MNNLCLKDLKSRLEKGNPLSDESVAFLERDPRKEAGRLLRKYRRLKLLYAKEQRLLDLEEQLLKGGCYLVAGVDEAGAGPLAGPVVAAAVILPVETSILGIDDSKCLTERVRGQLAERIKEKSVAWATGSCSPGEIDEINIYQASRVAMSRAVQALTVVPEILLVDARTIPDSTIRQKAIIKGDSNVRAIAAASIIAKTTRDNAMTNYAVEFPGYGFERHKGYGTRFHLEALKKLGPCRIHRGTFSPVKDYLF
ncbi:MAG: ribonuclease HII [Myxococcota bacterium]|nr:ribonuclease HII [Myxococcota bacterium]